QCVYLAFRLVRRGGDALVQALPEDLSKEVVIAVPPSLMVQGDQEQIGAFQIVQRRLPGRHGVEHHRLTHRAAQPLEDRGASKKVWMRSGCWWRTSSTK